MSMKRRTVWTTVGLLALLGSAIPAAADQLIFRLDIHNDEVPESARLIRVKQGDEVTLRFTTDKPIVLHLHGLELETRVVPGPPVDMTFIASATGRFPIHIHTPESSGGMEHMSLADVEVWPR
jgi:hypothetical protein